MQEHIYIAKRSRIIKQSFFIWLFVALHIAANIIIIPTLLKKDQIWNIALINILLGLITVPAVILFLNYYKHSVGKQFVVTYNSLKFIDDKTGKTIELKNSDINKIYLVKNMHNSRLPWIFHEYFSLTDNKNNKIVVTSYFMDIGDFWLDTLTRKVNSDNLVREKKMYPII